MCQKAKINDGVLRSGKVLDDALWTCPCTSVVGGGLMAHDSSSMLLDMVQFTNSSLVALPPVCPIVRPLQGGTIVPS